MGTADIISEDEKAIKTFIPSPSYVCSKCGKNVEIKGSVAVRTCEHEMEIIIASISAVCTGKSRT